PLAADPPRRPWLWRCFLPWPQSSAQALRPSAPPRPSACAHASSAQGPPLFSALAFGAPLPPPRPQTSPQPPHRDRLSPGPQSPGPHDPPVRDPGPQLASSPSCPLSSLVVCTYSSIASSKLRTWISN